MEHTNKLTELLKIKYPIISGGMVWVSGWKLASAVSNEGGLGLIGAGSMKPDLLSEHIEKCFKATDKPFGVNLPLLRKDADSLVDVIIQNKVKVVFTSAGNPAKYIDRFKKHNIIVVHVVPSVKHGKKAESVGCDAIVGEGYEAGGHNGPDEITTFSLIPQLCDNVSIPVIAAGGIADRRQYKAAMILGAMGVQIGTMFAASKESSASMEYKNAIIEAQDNSTFIAFRRIGLVRMLKNKYGVRVIEKESNPVTIEELRHLLGEKRERLGIFEGNTDEGMLEAGQGSGLVKEILSVHDIFKKLI